MGLDRARSKGRGLEVGEPPLSALSAANETVGRGYYAATTLSAVDPDLAVGNIKLDENIFGKVGTFEGAAEPTVTRCIYYDSTKVLPLDEWVIGGTYSVPASAIKIICVNSTSSPHSDYNTCKVRGVYNGVQKYTKSASIGTGYQVLDEEDFNGLGIEATLTLEHWADYSGRASGAAFYIT